MIYTINETHDPALKSWIESANDPASDFPLQNLPYGVFRSSATGPPRIGVAIGDMILDLAATSSLIEGLDRTTLAATREPQLNALMALDGPQLSTLRRCIQSILKTGSKRQSAAEKFLIPASDVQMLVPAHIGDYTDFYASIHHATNVGSLFRPENPLLPNYKYIPIAYHGRSSSIVPSGTAIVRPCGQQRAGENPPTFGPSRRLDYELEVGLFVGRGNELGNRISIEEAPKHIFGFCLVNDWSARDIQAWEYQPLGPFLGKNFGTTLSPWVIPAEALAPFAAAAATRLASDPAPLPYLFSKQDQDSGALNLDLEVFLSTRKMREQAKSPHRLCRTNFSTMYWTPAQMLTHHASNGCNLQTGDLLASGTVSGLTPDSLGSLLEITKGGKEPLQLPSGETRTFLEDGDEITLRGACTAPGFRRIGFGECRGTIQPARP